MTPSRPSFGDVTGEYRALRNSAAIIDDTHDLVWVTGPDAATFLQGILSQDVEGLSTGDVARSFLLGANGKLKALLWVLKDSERVGLLTEHGAAEMVAETLQYYRIRVKAEIDVDDRSVWSFVGPTSNEILEIESGWVLRDDAVLASAPMAGLARVLVAGDLPLSGHPRAGTIAATAVRVESGEPLMDVDVDEKTIPQETGLVPDAVSFTKGCFLGQELVARIDSRGRVNRHLRGVVMTRNVIPPDGAEAWFGDKQVGVLTSVTESLGVMAPIALCLLRREVSDGDELEIRWADQSMPAIARALPLF